jgi:glucosyl-dolichyl phosphate glucuronosyltransferase
LNTLTTSAGTRPSCTVIVCAYSLDRWPVLCEAIASLQGQGEEPVQIILVIDHNPELLELARASFDDVEVIPNAGPRGSSEAKNSAVAIARGEVLAFMDDDAIAAPDWLEQMLLPYRDATVIGTCGAPVPRWEGGEMPGWLPAEFLWTVGCAYRGLPEQPEPVRNPIGAAMSFRGEVFGRLGGFHAGLGPNMETPNPHGGGEDTEFGIRAQRLFPGGSLIHVPSARVDHNVPPQRTTFAYFVRRCWLEGRSKALLGATVGGSESLSSERAYVASTLPSGVRRGILDGMRGERAGFQRAMAISVGLATTALGYGRGRVGLLRDRTTTSRTEA